MKAILLCAILLVFPVLTSALEQDQIYSVSMKNGGVISYSFTYKRTTATWADCPAALRRALQNYNFRNATPSVYVLSPDSTTQVAIEALFASYSVSITTETMIPTAATQADIIASGIVAKKKIVQFVNACTRLRIANPTWDDDTVRDVAVGRIR